MNRQGSFFHRPLAFVLVMFAALSVHSQQQVEVSNYCPRCGYTNTYVADNIPGLYVLEGEIDNNGNVDIYIKDNVINRTIARWYEGMEQNDCRGGHDHIISVRTMNIVNGVTHYGPMFTTTVYLSPSEEEKTEMQTNQRIEVGNYCPELDQSCIYVNKNFPPLDENGEGDIEIDASVFEPLDWDEIVCKGGHNHVVWVRTSKVLHGYTLLSPMYTTTVYIPPKEETSPVLQSIEYFWDEDPGTGQGTPIAIPEGEEYDLTDFAIPADGMDGGDHLFGLRVKGNSGYGPTLIYTVKIPAIGDVNGDDDITIADVTALVNIILGKDNAEPHLYDHKTADVNRDNNVTIADVTALVNIILGKNTSPNP